MSVCSLPRCAKASCGRRNGCSIDGSYKCPDLSVSTFTKTMPLKLSKYCGCLRNVCMSRKQLHLCKPRDPNDAKAITSLTTKASWVSRDKSNLTCTNNCFWFHMHKKACGAVYVRNDNFNYCVYLSKATSCWTCMALFFPHDHGCIKSIANAVVIDVDANGARFGCNNCCNCSDAPARRCRAPWQHAYSNRSRNSSKD